MDDKTSTLVAGLLVGLLVGVPGGLLIASVKASMAKLAEAKKAVPAAKKTARSTLSQALILGFLLLMVLALALGSSHNGV